MKIGITTHYYNSNNYGGNLQAYALCKVLSNNGKEAEQICFSAQARKKSMAQLLREKGVVFFFKNLIKRFTRSLKRLLKNDKKILQLISLRQKRMLDFNRKIPHSDVVYNSENIVEAKDRYDYFITGSDQVWHPSAINKAYTLEFVKNKPKISYAASISVSALSDSLRNYFKDFLSDYSAVSVREKNAVEIVKDLSPVAVEWVLDPTMLLSKEEWTDILEECDIKEKFVFCYFLGDERQERMRAKEFAREKGLKIVDIPHLQCHYEKADKNFADISIYDASPGQFLWLVKNAEFVFSDSFHSTVFSLIFEKEFFVFERAKHKGMGERIRSLLGLFDAIERFITDDKSKELNYLTTMPKMDYSEEFIKFTRMQEYSLKYLLENVGR